MKQPKLLLYAIVLASLSVSSYAQKVYKEGNYFVIDADGMPAASVKTAPEVASGTIDPATGIVYRHTQALGNLGNPSVNAKVSPKFAVSPKDISSTGVETEEISGMNWMVASGWRNDGNTSTSDGVYSNTKASGVVAITATGCKAYGGPGGSEKGQWRLPTLRELMLIWVLHEKLRLLASFTSMDASYYLSSTEANGPGICFVRFDTGGTGSTGKTDANRVRCVRDL